MSLVEQKEKYIKDREEVVKQREELINKLKEAEVTIERFNGAIIATAEAIKSIEEASKQEPEVQEVPKMKIEK